MSLLLYSLKLTPIFLTLLTMPALAQWEQGKPMQIAPVTVHHDVAIRVVAGQASDRPRPHRRANKRPAPLPQARPAQALAPKAVVPQAAPKVKVAVKRQSLFERAKWGLVRAVMRLKARFSRH